MIKDTNKTDKWQEVKLGNVCPTVFSGGTPDTRVSEYWAGNNPWLSSGETRNAFISRTEKKVTDLAVNNSSTRWAQKGDVVIASAGQGRTRGQVSFLMIDTLINQSLIAFRPNIDQLDSLFLFYNLSSRYEEIRSLSDSSSTRGSITGPLMKSLTLKIPDSLVKQRNISGMLFVYDSLISNNEKRIKTLEEIAQLLYVEWFIKFKFPGYEKVKMIDSRTEVGLVPAEWEVVKIGSKFDVILGGTPSRNNNEYWEKGTVSWINSGKVNELRIIDESELITEEALEESATKIMAKRTTLLAITGATLGQVSLTEIECCANQSVVGISDKSLVYSEYIYLKINEIINNIIALAGGGAQQHINKDIVSSTEVLIPSESIAKEFQGLIKPIFDEIASLMFKNKNLLKIRDLLIAQLITGKRKLK
jgi:type I restriction enzyme S subunit